MELANEKMRARLVKVMNEAIASDCCPAEYKEVFAEWINNMLDAEKTKELAEKIIPMVEAAKDKCNHRKQIAEPQAYLVERSQWIIGGDGALRLGCGGLDPIIASGGRTVNILVAAISMRFNSTHLVVSLLKLLRWVLSLSLLLQVSVYVRKTSV